MEFNNEASGKMPWNCDYNAYILSILFDYESVLYEEKSILVFNSVQWMVVVL